MTEKKRAGAMRVFLFIYGFARPYYFPLIVGTLLYSTQMVMFPLMNSVLMGGITGAMTSGNLSALFIAALHVLGMVLLCMLMAFFGVILYVGFGTKTLQRLQTRIFRMFVKTGAEEHTHSGERLSMLNTDVAAAHDLYTNALAGVLFSLLPMLILSVVIFSIDWRIGLFTIFIGIVATAGQVLFARPIAKIAKKTLETTATTAKTIGDIFSGGIIARVFRLQDHLLSVFGHDNEALRLLVNREARIDGARKLLSGISDLLTTGGVFVVGSIFISRGGMTLSSLMSMLPLCSTVATSIAGFGAAWAGMQAPLEAGKRIYSLLGGDNRLDPLPEAKAPVSREHPEQRKACSVTAEGLSFTYPGAESAVLTDVSLSIGGNQLAAFVGESGSGKSTLLKIIAGLRKCDGAEISVGGVLLSEDDLSAWRANFAYVDQSCTLFNLTIAENIGLGREGASFDEIKAAAAEADADGFIMSFPQGYDTPVGEVGALLSGGQRQRIAIARALIRRAPVLVLDEATSALDADSEREILDTIHHLRKNHTILMITHNLAAVRPDVTFRVEDGRVVVQESVM